MWKWTKQLYKKSEIQNFYWVSKIWPKTTNFALIDWLNFGIKLRISINLQLVNGLRNLRCYKIKYKHRVRAQMPIVCVYVKHVKMHEYHRISIQMFLGKFYAKKKTTSYICKSCFKCTRLSLSVNVYVFCARICWWRRNKIIMHYDLNILLLAKKYE